MLISCSKRACANHAYARIAAVVHLQVDGIAHLSVKGNYTDASMSGRGAVFKR